MNNVFYSGEFKEKNCIFGWMSPSSNKQTKGSKYLEEINCSLILLKSAHQDPEIKSEIIKSVKKIYNSSNDFLKKSNFSESEENFKIKRNSPKNNAFPLDDKMLNKMITSYINEMYPSKFEIDNLLESLKQKEMLIYCELIIPREPDDVFFDGRFNKDT